MAEVVRNLIHTAKELRILKTINKIVNSTDNLDVLIKKVAGMVSKELHAPLVFIILRDNEEYRIKNLDERKPLHPEFREILKTIARDTVSRASPIFIKQAKFNTKISRFGIMSMISAPLMAYTGPIGSIILMSQQRNFSMATFKILNAVAVQTAYVIQHIWLRHNIMEKDKKIVDLYDKLYGKEARRAIIDQLTGLYNRRYFIELINKQIEKKKYPSLILLDLDFFKSYNDKYGHVEGDKLLKEIGKILQKKARKTKACRYGGEEFAILVNSDYNDAIRIAELLRKEIESFYPNRSKRNITASFGVGKRKRGEKREDFIKRVDSALYKAKSMGRNTVWTAKTS
jgi:diguanylate cyclase (GGDEF)-like protein